MSYARYTTMFYDYLKTHPNTLKDIIVMDDEEKSNKLISMIYAKWYNYEVGGETPFEFEMFLKNVFDKYKDYYTELLNVYETKINWIDGITESETYSNTNNGENNVNTLPNRIVSSNGTYLTEKDTQSSTSSGNRSKKGGKTQADLKVEYMKQIRNIYDEFAEKFGVCFISLLD